MLGLGHLFSCWSWKNQEASNPIKVIAVGWISKVKGKLLLLKIAYALVAGLGDIGYD